MIPFSEMTIDNELLENPILKIYLRGAFLASPPNCEVDAGGTTTCTENVTVTISNDQNNQTEVCILMNKLINHCVNSKTL